MGHSDKDAEKNMDTINSTIDPSMLDETVQRDDEELKALGYVPSFKREFTNLATISFAFSIMGLCSSVATTFNTPLLTGGPASVVWCWLLGAVMCFTLGTSIAEIVSAFPTCGGLYTASAQLTPRKYRAIVGWIVGWLNILGQIAGVSSTEFGLANMIWSAVAVAKGPDYTYSQGQVVALFAGLMVFHGILVCMKAYELLIGGWLDPFLTLRPELISDAAIGLFHQILRVYQSRCYLHHHRGPSCNHTAVGDAPCRLCIWVTGRHESDWWLAHWFGFPIWPSECSMDYDCNTYLAIVGQMLTTSLLGL
jgi:hypothetical protein